MNRKTLACTANGVGVGAAVVAAAGAGFEFMELPNVVALIALSIGLTATSMMVALLTVLNVGPVQTAFHLGVQAGRIYGPDSERTQPLGVCDDAA